MSFFDNLGKKISDTTHTVVEKTKTSTDTIRLNSMISEEERKINNTYTNIGKKYMELHGKDGDADFAEFVDAIGQSRLKIDEYREQIRRNKGLLICAGCGAEIPETILYCTKCGAENPVGKRLAEERAAKEAAERAAQEAAEAQRRAAAQQAAAAPSGELCPNCGKPRTAGAMFCTGCGTRFVTPEAAAAPTPAAPSAVCPNCGTSSAPGMKFCTCCGTRLPEANPIPTPVPVEESPAPAADPIPAPASTEETPAPAADPIPAPAPAEESPAPAADPIPAPASTAETPVPAADPIPAPVPAEETPAPAADPIPAPAPAEESPDSTAETERLCPNCGNPVASQYKFCTRCGTKMPEK